MKEITIFTPTFNRAYILGRAYDSLLQQTNKEFIWCIIDDGSTDNTEDLVKKWLEEKKIEIQYIKQENGGKHVAHNAAVKKCKTNYMLILDSDDYLSEKTIEILLKDIENIKNKKNISGIIGNKFDGRNGNVIGTNMPTDIDYASGIELYQRYGFEGDTLRIYKTEILKQFLFPIIKGEKFIYENVVFEPIDSKYKMLINREKLYYCEYLKDGYTSNSDKIKKENPYGYALSLKSSAKYAINFINKIKYNILLIIWIRRYNLKKEMSLQDKGLFYFAVYPLALIFEKLKIPKFFFNRS